MTEPTNGSFEEAGGQEGTNTNNEDEVQVVLYASPSSQTAKVDPAQAVLNGDPSILEQVLFQLPITDLLTSAVLVCQKWKDIVMRSNFCLWKKAYQRYKTGRTFLYHPPAPERFAKASCLNDIVYDQSCRNFTSHFGTSADKFAKVAKLELIFPFLISWGAKEAFPITNSTQYFSPVTRHSKYALAHAMVSTCHPDLSDNHVASIIAVCIVAEDAWDVTELIQVCFRSSGNVMMLTELLYFVCLAFKLFADLYRTPIRYHFNVYQALYYFENNSPFRCKQVPVKAVASPSPAKRQRTLMDFGIRNYSANTLTPTSEQARIVNHKINPGSSDIVKIVAFAGTGKTTTLIKLCEANPHLRFLVVMYNAAVRDDAKKKFPKDNVTCKTAHGLALSSCPEFRKKMVPNIKPRFLINHLEKEGEGSTSTYKRAGLVAKTLERFMASKAEEIAAGHVPDRWNGKEVDQGMLNSTVRDAENIWAKMSDPVDFSIKISHDGYLKVWQLRHPDLKEAEKHDVLLVDEGQDMNPAMLDVFSRQETPRFIVGDPHQQIYLFRGAVNALDLVDAQHIYHLTQSFRFGPEVAFVANCILEKVKEEPGSRTLVGGKKKDTMANAEDLKGKPRVAFIGRTNRAVLDQAIKLICDSGNSMEIPKVGRFAGGIAGYKLDDYLNILYLMKGEQYKIPASSQFSRYKTYQQLENFARSTEDTNLVGKIMTVRDYGDSLVGYVEKLKRLCTETGKMGVSVDYVFTTAHKAKGLEWDHVVLLNDLESAFEDPNFDNSAYLEGERNLLYVALTRAKKTLVLTRVIWRLLQVSSYTLEHIVLTEGKAAVEGGNCPSCSSPSSTCGPLALEARAVTDLNIVGGILCQACASKHDREFPGPLLMGEDPLQFLFAFGVLPPGEGQARRFRDHNRAVLSPFLNSKK